MKSRPDRYGSVAVTIHWLGAIAIFVLIGSGFGAAMTADPALKTGLLRVHVPLAIAVLALTVVRVAWWVFIDRKPGPIADTPAWQEAGARAVHILLYIALFMMLGSGIALMAASGAAPVLFGNGGVLPDFTQFVPRTAHGVGAVLIVTLLAAHIGAALYHHLVRHDNIFRRMWYGRSR